MVVVERTVNEAKDDDSTDEEETKKSAPSAEVLAANDDLFSFKAYQAEIYTYLKSMQVREM